jgi:predicted PurR-regulated permease PerM
MDRKVFMAILLVLAVVALLYLTVTIFDPFLLALLWAAVLATVTYGTYERIRKRMKGRETPAALYMTVLVLVLIVVPVLFMGVVLSQQVVDFVQGFEREEFLAKIQEIENHWAVKRLLGFAQKLSGSDTPLTLKEVVQPALAWARDTAGPEALRGAAGAVGFLFSFGANLFFILLALYYFYKEGPTLVRVLRELIPMREESRDEILGEIRSAIVASVKGGLLTAVVQGLLGVVIFVILGIGSPIFWGFVMALASLVPVIGTALVWLPMAAALLIQGQTLDGVVLIVYGVAVIGMSDNFLRPILVGRHLEVHPLLLFFGILGGIASFGFVGLVLGPVAVAFLLVSSRLLRREFRAAESEA